MEGEDHYAQGDEARVGYPGDVGLVELGPGHDGADVDEGAGVEEEVDGGVHLVVAALGFLEVIAIPVKGCAGGEAGEEVADADAAAGAEYEQADRGWEQEVALVVDPFSSAGVSIGQETHSQKAEITIG